MNNTRELHFREFFPVFLFSFAFECKIAAREKDEEINCLCEIDCENRK